MRDIVGGMNKQTELLERSWALVPLFATHRSLMTAERMIFVSEPGSKLVGSKRSATSQRLERVVSERLKAFDDF